jgi:hypothetical protein
LKISRSGRRASVIRLCGFPSLSLLRQRRKSRGDPYQRPLRSGGPHTVSRGASLGRQS